MIKDFHLSEPELSKQLDKLIEENPSIGSYNRTTGWFEYYLVNPSLKEILKDSWVVTILVSFIFLISFSVIYSSLSKGIFFMFLAMFLGGLLITFNEVYDKRTYLKDFKL